MFSDGFTVVDVRDPRPNSAKVTQSSSPGMD
jgi:hypothetical protein